MQLAVCWPGTHGSQPHAHDDDKKSQRSWASIIMARRLEDVGLALPLCYAMLTILMRATVCASIKTPLHLLPWRSFVRLRQDSSEAAQNPDNGHPSPRVHHHYWRTR
jgi:hypothetical protein